ncbi:MAG: sulfatase-like hydrolase/transferase [Paracoccaceae bacterium]
MTLPSPRAAWCALLAAALLHVVLIQPNHPAAMTWGALSVLSLEWVVLLLALPVLGDGRLGRVIRALLTAVLTLIVVLKSADFAMFTSFTRGFNPVGDLPLLAAAFRLLWGSVGLLGAIGALIGTVLAIVALAASLWWAMGVWARVALPRPALFAARAGAVLTMGLAVMDVGAIMARWPVPFNAPGTAFTARVGVERVALIRNTLADLRAFNALARTDPFAARAGLLDKIDRDVLVIFVESYGRTSLDTPFYAQKHRPLLANATRRLEQAGLAVQSAYLSSPTRGGQSWLAHATFANGMRVDGQARYQAAIASGRETLFHIAARSGFHTAAVMPAITLDWPEAAFMGFDTILPAADLGYRGLPFNWVTMPDQFTLAAMDRLVREPVSDQRVFAQVALISSHAPWVPIPRMIPWEELGDGSIFNDMAMSGDRPDVVWRDHDRVRDQYRMSISYALEVVVDYAIRHADDPPLMIVLGDHQAAGFIALDERSDVPIHLIGPADLLGHVADWGWTRSMIPAATAPVLPMEAMRDLLIEAFSTTLPTGASLPRDAVNGG